MKFVYTHLVSASVICAVIASVGLVAFAADTSDDAEPEPISIDSEKDGISYAVGVQVGGSILQGGLDVNPDMVLRGIRDTLEHRELAMSDMELQQAMMALQKQLKEQEEQMQQEMQQRQMEQQQELPQQLPPDEATPPPPPPPM